MDTYEALPLTELAELIVQKGDRGALRELHDRRTVFVIWDNRKRLNLLLADYLRALCQTKLISPDAIASDVVYDLALDRFNNLPERKTSVRGGGERETDCRNYFRAFLEKVASWREENSGASPLLEEIEAARILQEHVGYHFELSCMEAKRSANPAHSRYAWHVGGGVIPVRLPKSLAGGDRRAWLERNIPDPDPARPGEQSRVQSIIDELLGLPRCVPIKNEDDLADVRHYTPAAIGGISRGEPEGFRIAEAVAEKEVQDIKRLPPSIGKKLGESGVRRLILHIFERLFQGSYDQSETAKAFNLTASALSRYAGQRWFKQEGGRIPRLWRTTAEVLAADKRFVEAIRNAGLLERIERACGGEAEPQEESG
jgi:hypothetical protein